MTLKEFDHLSWDEQYECMLDKGVVVGNRENNYFEMTLYRVDDFYVEFKRQRRDGELYIGSICHEILLVPYLEQTDLSKLFNS
jgi:hypothetical protein